jgi:hypothetical protein
MGSGVICTMTLNLSATEQVVARILFIGMYIHDYCYDGEKDGIIGEPLDGVGC